MADKIEDCEEWSRMNKVYKNIKKAFSDMDEVYDWLSEWEHGELSEIAFGALKQMQVLVWFMPAFMEDVKKAYEGGAEE